MRYLRSALRLALTAALLLGASLGSPQAAQAQNVHNRYGNLTWRSLGSNRVQFRATMGFQRSNYTGSAPDGFLAVGDTFTENIGGTGLYFGDLATSGANAFLTGSGYTGLRFKVTAIDTTRDWVVGVALDPNTGSERIIHQYTSPVDATGKPWIAEYAYAVTGKGVATPDCCWQFSTNNTVPAYAATQSNLQFFRIQATVDLNQNTSSAVTALPPIIPIGPAGGSFTVPGLDTDANTTLTFRLSQDASTTDATINGVGESGIINPPGVQVDPQTGVVTVPAGLKLGPWSTQVVIEEHAGGAGGTVVGRTAVSFVLNVQNQTGNAPTFVPPTPASNTPRLGIVGRRLAYTVWANDPDNTPAQLNSTGAPINGGHNPALPAFNLPVISSFSWTPGPNDVGAYMMTYSAEDLTGNFVITSVPIVVEPALVVNFPNGSETFLQNTPVTIRWNSGGFPRPGGINIQLSTDGGATFPITIASKVADTGSFNWTTPAVITTQARIRVVNATDSTDFDISDSNFTISDGALEEICTPVKATEIPDYTPHPWTVIPLSYGSDRIIRGLGVKVNITHPFIGDLQVFLAPPDFVGDPANPFVDTTLNQQAVLLHGNTGGRTANLITTFGFGAGQTKPAEAATSWASKLYGRKSKGVWNLWIRDLKPGDVGQINQWCLDVTGPVTGDIAVTAPNTGSERWAIGTTQQVKWTQTNVVGNVDIVLSRDGGANFNEVLGTVPAASGVFNWTVTAPVTSTAKIRVQSSTDHVVQDDSDAAFAIMNPFLTILRPTAGEGIAIGQPYTVQWDSVPMLGAETVKIELLHSDNPGFTQLLAAAAPNTGSFTFTPTAGMATDHARLRITANSAPARVGTMSGDFAIQTPSIDVTSPGSGAVWYTYTTQSIAWRSVGLGGNVKIELSRDNGATWDVLFASTPNDGSEPWVVSGNPSANAKIRVTSLDDPSVSGVSPAFVLRTMTVTVTSPNGGEVWGTGTSRTITWTTDGVTGNVDILLSQDSGGSFTPLATNVPNNGSYGWIVNGAANGTGLIQVKAHDFPAFDVSDAPFTITGPSIQVTAPTSGQELRVGNQATLSWTSTGLTGSVKVEISRGGGAFTQLFTGLPNTGSQPWTVTGPDGPAVIRVTSLDTPNISGDSASFKVVTPSLQLTAPNGGENWTENDTKTISWSAAGFDGPVRIELSRDNGTSWETISSAAQNTGSAQWKVTGPGTKKALVRVSSISNAALTDTSDGTFTIVAQFLKLGSPNGGEFLAPGTQTVTWSSSGLPSQAKVKLELSRDGGGSWSTLADQVPNSGSAAVTMPGPASTTARVRISLDSNPSIQDTSDANFTLSAATLRVTAPGAGVKWALGSTVNITWTGTVVSARAGTVKVELSRNGGSTWETLYGSTEDDGSVQWLVSGTATNKARVRVTWNEAPGGPVTDTSAIFSITKPKKKK